MPLIIPVGKALVAWHTRTEGDPEDMITTHAFDISAAAEPDQLVEVAKVAWGVNMAPLVSTVVTLVNTVVREGPNDTGETRESPGATPGTNTESLLPPNSAVLVKKITGLGGRHGRGRMFLPGVSIMSGTLDSTGSFSSGDATTIGDGVTAMMEDIHNADPEGPFVPLLLHGDSTLPTEVTSWVCEPKIASQRRRLRP